MATVSDSIKEKLRTLIQEVIGCHDEAAAGGSLEKLREVVNDIPKPEREITLREVAGKDFGQLSTVFLV